MSKLYVVNTGKVTLPVPIVSDETGERTEIQLQPGGKPFLPPNYQVDPTFLARNPAVRQVAYQLPSAGNGSAV